MSDTPSPFTLVNSCFLKNEKFTDDQIIDGWNNYLAARYLACDQDLIFEAIDLSRKNLPPLAAYMALYEALPKVTLRKGQRLPLKYTKEKGEDDPIVLDMRKAYGVTLSVARRWAELAKLDKNLAAEAKFLTGDLK